MCVTCVIKLSPSAKQWVENKGKGKVRPKGQVHKKTEKFGRLHQQKNEFSKWISWLPVRHLNHYATTSKKRGSRVIETKHDNSFCLRQNRRGQSQVKEETRNPRCRRLFTFCSCSCNQYIYYQNNKNQTYKNVLYNAYCAMSLTIKVSV